jgi:endonuclease YncB( thermonuclease family)
VAAAKPGDPNNHRYRVRVERVIDGDTFVGIVDVGFRATLTLPIRIFGINAPEHTAPGGPEATAALTELLTRAGEAGVICETYKPTANAGADKYGRWLAAVAGLDGRDIGAQMIASGQAVAYFGGAR